MTETQERFLRSVLTRVSLDDVVEMHLFPPIRRGTMETGVAVIATILPPPPLTVIDASSDMTADVIAESSGDVAVVDEALAESTSADIVVAEGEVATIETTDDDQGAVESSADETVDHDADATATGSAEDGASDDSPYADEPVTADAAGSGEFLDGDVADDAEAADVADAGVVAGEAEADQAAEIVAPRTPSPRMRILTAAYRHTIKGIDRGKWVVDVQEEADAPLEAVEAVLRGVRHRSTEPADPELVSHDVLAALIEPTRIAPAA